jgi:hypothetical protein
MGKKLDINQPLQSEQIESLLKLLVYITLDRQEGIGMLDAIKQNTKLRDYLFGHWDAFQGSKQMSN